MISSEFVPKIHRFDVVSSTNLKLKEFALGGADEGTIVVATRQTAGRGRGNIVTGKQIGRAHV